MKNRALLLIFAVLFLTGCSPPAATITTGAETSVSTTTALSGGPADTTTPQSTTSASSSAQSQPQSLEPYEFSVPKVLKLLSQEITIFDLYVDTTTLVENQVIMVYSNKNLATTLPINTHSVAIHMLQNGEDLNSGIVPH